MAKKDMGRFKRQTIGRTALMAQQKSSQEIADSLRQDELGILNAQYRGLDFYMDELKREGLSLLEMAELQREYINAGGIITTIPARRKSSRRKRSNGSSVATVKASFTAKTNSDGSFMWEEGK
jgi:hypothetical protein